MRRARRLVERAMLIAVAILAGCSDPSAPRAVSGFVKLEGQPLKEGSISFEPLDKQGTKSGAPIIDGEYDIPADHGLKPGMYVVQITAGDGKTPANVDEIAAPGGGTNIVSVDLVPEDWNTKSQQVIEIKPSGPNRFDFDIPRANRPKKR
jgi:hypothetical protein